MLHPIKLVLQIRYEINCINKYMFTLETILGSYIQYFMALGRGNVVTESKLYTDSTETPSSNGDWTMT